MNCYLRDNDRGNLLAVSEYAEKFSNIVGWNFSYQHDRYPPSLRDHLYSPDAQMILIPLDNSTYISSLPAMRATDCSVLTFELGSTKSGALTAYFAHGRMIDDEVRYDEAMRLWFSVSNELYLAPAPDGDNPCGECFSLEKQGITPAPSPWCDHVDYVLGFVDANLKLFAQT